MDLMPSPIRVLQFGLRISVDSCQGTTSGLSATELTESSGADPQDERQLLRLTAIPMNKINIAEKFDQIHEYWKPYIAAELNGQSVKLDKLKGEFIWHHHQNEDEMFLVVKGRFRMEYRDKEFRDRHLWIEEGEFIVVPRGVEHRPVAEEEAWIMLFEPASILNTGNVQNEMTLHELERV
jgi:mannose-6-phosphate isomerase-like protein (cupin superfamily)